MICPNCNYNTTKNLKKRVYGLCDTILLNNEYNKRDKIYFFTIPIGQASVLQDGRHYIKNNYHTNMVLSSMLPYPREFSIESCKLEFDGVQPTRKELEIFKKYSQLQIHYGIDSFVYKTVINKKFTEKLYLKAGNFLRVDLEFLNDIKFSINLILRLTLDGVLYEENDRP